ncbi:YwaF family protein [Changchengzhania lutea]|uniref:YwaF family protein n=1 Tax=Changchengzhania lutea TaxID=2049305 RepID=UPI001FE764DD|nr:TIGR02206 family membrane protein [Changchengzhania lutea]
MNWHINQVMYLFTGVSIGSAPHIFPILIALIFAVFFIRYAKKKLQKKQQHVFLHLFGCLVCLTVLVFHVYKIFLGNYKIATDLPLYLCSFLALLIPIFTQYRKYWMYEILLFWIIAGTSQGIITPDIADGFPSFDYFRYWVVHLGLVIVILYATFVLKMKPKLSSVFKSFFALQLYVICIMFINHLLDANYFYLNKKPASASLLDYFGEWPYYIITTQIIIIPYFLLIYLPFHLSKRSYK